MARKPRLYLQGVPQHVVQRGNHRHARLFAGEDYRYYLECLADAASRHSCQIPAYLLMTNPVHLLVSPQEEYALSAMMQPLGHRYVRYVNHLYKHGGRLGKGASRLGWCSRRTIGWPVAVISN